MFKDRISNEELKELPLSAFEGEIVVVDAPGEVYDKAVEYLGGCTLLGFDTETRPSFSPGTHYGTALLQLSSEDRAFLFRLNCIGLPAELKSILRSKSIKKIGAAVLDDIRGLQRHGMFTPGGFVDLQKEVGKFGICELGVKKMAGIILGVKISKAQQLSNWESAALSPAQQRYAATDAWICREMYLKLQENDKDIS